MRQIILLLLRLSLLFALPLLGGCETLRYYWQAVQGQWELIDKAKPISELLSDPALDPTLRHKLEQVNAARQYAAETMRLPVENAYTRYVALDRPAVVWNIVAAPEFSLEAKRWCFPVAGCVKYKGYFDLNMARNEAKALQDAQYDVALGSVAAYSTLGWFDDPVLSTFINDTDENLQRLILHELAHRQFYVSGDTTLNESWATAVAAQGLEELHPSGSESRSTVREHRPFETVFLEESLHLRDQLRQLYDDHADHPDRASIDEWRAQKQTLIATFQRRLENQAKHVDEASRYAHWWQNPVNNAHLIAVHNYHRWVDGLRYQLEVVLKGDWKAFYAWSETTLEPLDETARSALLDSLNAQANPE